MSPALLDPASQMDLRWKSPDVERGGRQALHTLTRKQRKSIEKKTYPGADQWEKGERQRGCHYRDEKDRTEARLGS